MCGYNPVDKDGWEYSTDLKRFNDPDRAPRGVCRWSDKVRRKRWIRYATSTLGDEKGNNVLENRLEVGAAIANVTPKKQMTANEEVRLQDDLIEQKVKPTERKDPSLLTTAFEAFQTTENAHVEKNIDLIDHSSSSFKSEGFTDESNEEQCMELAKIENHGNSAAEYAYKKKETLEVEKNTHLDDTIKNDTSIFSESDFGDPVKVFGNKTKIPSDSCSVDFGCTVPHRRMLHTNNSFDSLNSLNDKKELDLMEPQGKKNYSPNYEKSLFPKIKVENKVPPQNDESSFSVIENIGPSNYRYNTEKNSIAIAYSKKEEESTKSLPRAIYQTHHSKKEEQSTKYLPKAINQKHHSDNRKLIDRKLRGAVRENDSFWNMSTTN